MTESLTPTTQADESRTKTLWSGIWDAQTIPKIKSYMWKFATNAIAVEHNLIQRGLSNIFVECPICGGEKTSKHMNFGCSWTRAIWFGMLGVQDANQSSQTIEQWLGDRIREPGSTSSAYNTRWTICMTTCWHI